jgi:hypothetical protein
LWVRSESGRILDHALAVIEDDDRKVAIQSRIENHPRGSKTKYHLIKPTMSHPEDEFRPPRARRLGPDDEDAPLPGRRQSESDDDDDENEVRPRRRRGNNEFEATELLVPTGVSAYSIIACYAGLIGMCLPLAGLVFSIPAFICAIIALRQRRKAATYGAVTSDIRAIAGLIMSTIGLLIGGGMLLMILVKEFGK